MKRKFRNSLTGIQIIMISILVLIGVVLIVNAQPYRQETEWAADVVEFEFLQKGIYTLEITYLHSPANNSITVSSNLMPNTEGKMGVLYAEAAIQRGSGVVQIPFELRQGTYGIQVKMAEDDGEACTLKSVILQSNNLIYKDNYFFGFLILLSAVGLLFCFLILPPEKYGIPLALLAMGIVATLPVLSQSLFDGDDLRFHVTRLEGIYLGLQAGEFPVRITPQQMEGYGGLTATMYPQLFLYPFAILRMLGVSLMNCYKLLLCSINVATAFISYYALKNICKSSRVALLMSFFYTFSLYRLTNMYVRAALGEALAMTFLPLLIWGTYEILWGRRRWVILALGMTGILQSHVLSVEMVALFMMLELFFWMISRKKTQFVGRFLDGVKSVGLTLLLNAGFLVPFLYFSREDLQCFILPSTTSKTGAYFSQMFSLLPAPMGVNYTNANTKNELPISVGLVFLLGIFIFIYAYRKNQSDHNFEVGKHSLFLGVLALILSSWLFPWNRLEEIEVLDTLCSSLQFAWRFLSIASVFLCIVLAVGLDKILDESEGYKCLAYLSVGLALVSAWNIYDRLSFERSQWVDTMQLERMDMSDGMYMYRETDTFEQLQGGYDRSEAELVACNNEVQFLSYLRRGSGLEVDVMLEEGASDRLVFPIYWYPGYEIVVDGQAVEAEQYQRKLSCEVSGETGMIAIEVKYAGFWFFTLANVVAWITFAGILCGGIFLHVKARGRKAVERT